MRERLVSVICDTSFLMHMATKRVVNLDRLDVEIGNLSFLVPDVVKSELSDLARDPAKRRDAERTLDFIKGFGTAEAIRGTFADGAIADYASRSGGRAIIATMDRGLKRRVKSEGCSVLSFSNDRIVLEE